MNRPSSRSVRFLTVLTAAFILRALPAPASGWTFTDLPAPTPPYEAWGTPALNAAGGVVFTTWLLDDTEVLIYLDGNGPRIVAAADGSPFISFTGAGSMQLVNDPDLDDQGRVVFRAYTYDAETWTYTGAAYLDDHGSRVVMTSEFGGPGPWLDWCNPVLAGDGTCALFTWDASWQVQTLWCGPAPSLTAIMDNGGPVHSFTTEVATAAGGLVVVRTSDDDNDQRILRCTGTSATLISSRVRDGYYDYRDGLAVNASGQVAFRAQLGEWVEGICVGDGGAPTVVVHNDGTDFFSFSSPGLDDHGRLIFKAQLMNWSDGIFTGPDPENDKLIAEGDSLFGAQVWGVELGRHGVNAAGDVAFHYWLDDGRDGIAIARRAGGSAVDLPAATALAVTCSPNPFNPRTTLQFTLPRADHVRVAVHALDGRLVAVLLDGDLASGPHAMTWDGTGDDGRERPSGTYIARVRSGSAVAAAKIVLLR